MIYNRVIDWNRRIYAISTVTHTRWPGNNGRLLTTRNCVLTHVGQANTEDRTLFCEAKTLCIWGMCVYAQRHEVYAENSTLLCKN